MGCLESLSRYSQQHICLRVTSPKPLLPPLPHQWWNSATEFWQEAEAPAMCLPCTGLVGVSTRTGSRASSSLQVCCMAVFVPNCGRIWSDAGFYCMEDTSPPFSFHTGASQCQFPADMDKWVSHCTMYVFAVLSPYHWGSEAPRGLKEMTVDVRRLCRKWAVGSWNFPTLLQEAGLWSAETCCEEVDLHWCWWSVCCLLQQLRVGALYTNHHP